MAAQKQIVISASRRTDIPAFYMPWFMGQIEAGFFERINPFNRKISQVAATPDHVHTIVFWSKNFKPFLAGRYGETLQQMGYGLFFNFTINSDSSLLEPNVPPLEERLEQLSALCSRFDPRSVQWRFDPVCYFRDQNGRMNNNLSDFSHIAAHAADKEITRCITSFMDHYQKIKRRTVPLSGISFIDPAVDKKLGVLGGMEKILTEKKIQLYVCCEKELTNALPAGSSVRGSSCIPSDYLLELYGGTLSLARDQGQRIEKGCGCRVSVDIGGYQQHPCFHNCLFCYANPTETAKKIINGMDIAPGQHS